MTRLLSSLLRGLSLPLFSYFVMPTLLSNDRNPRWPSQNLLFSHSGPKMLREFDRCLYRGSSWNQILPEWNLSFAGTLTGTVQNENALLYSHFSRLFASPFLSSSCRKYKGPCVNQRFQRNPVFPNSLAVKVWNRLFMSPSHPLEFKATFQFVVGSAA